MLQIALTLLLCTSFDIGPFIPLDCKPFAGTNHALIAAILLALNIVLVDSIAQ